jgi:site-specific DNA recombinase
MRLLPWGAFGEGPGPWPRAHSLQHHTRSGHVLQPSGLLSGRDREAVLAGLQQHLKAPQILKEFAEAYQMERMRLANQKRSRRSKLESQLGQVQRGIDRLWADYEAERISMDIAGPKLKELHAQKAAFEADLAGVPDDEPAIRLHPTALSQYERHVSELHMVFGQGVSSDYEEAADRIRNLIARVIVSPQEKGFKLELQGRLALLMEAPNGSTQALSEYADQSVG